jgi:hypothetical protein
VLSCICNGLALPRRSIQGIPSQTAKSLPVLFRSAIYALRGGFLIRPFVIALTLGAAGAVLSSLEEQRPAIGSFVPQVLFPSHADPQVAQAILTAIATSIMTVVAIVFAILLMTLTLASTQFSPRILIGYVRDRVTQCERPAGVGHGWLTERVDTVADRLDAGHRRAAAGERPQQ